MCGLGGLFMLIIRYIKRMEVYKKIRFILKSAKYFVQFRKNLGSSEEFNSENVEEIIIENQNSNSNEIPKTIWMYWDSENPPDYINHMVNRIKKLNRDHDVVLLNKRTLSNYIDDYITGRKDITPAAKSDFIRLELLKKYGGIWMDSTTICFASFDWVHKAYNKHRFDVIGYFRNTSTVDRNNPVIESWFLASPKNNNFISMVLEEFYNIINIGYNEYFKKINSNYNYSDLVQKITDPYYLLIYLSMQIVMRKEKFSFYLRDADTTAFFYQEMYHWKPADIALSLTVKKQPVTPPELIKLTSSNRITLDFVMRHHLYKKDSIIWNLYNEK